MIKIIFLIFIYINLFSNTFKVASYNIENLFDMKNNGTEYKEFKPYSKYWNDKALKIKLNNVTRVISDLDADIIGLQEIENKNAFNILKSKLPKYKYGYFLKKKTSSIGVAILSKYKIINNKSLQINKYNPHSRPILKSTVIIENKKLIIYVNHWRSKRAKESKRIPYAQSLITDIKTLNNSDDYIILGDLNSNYDEYLTIKNEKKLNDTYGITGINQVLNTSLNHNFVNKIDILNKNNIHYNLWLDIGLDNRFSSIFKGKNTTPDNIILPHSLFDKKNISYVDNSFNIFKKAYFYKNNNIKRWNMKKHYGYSDHLPIYAYFSTKIQKYTIKKKVKKEYIIDDLYNIQKLHKNVLLKNITVIYKSENIAIIKADNQKAIMIYGKNNNLKEGYIYDISVKSVITYRGLKEINKFKIIKEYSYENNYKKYYINYKDIDDISYSNQNEIIQNISGIYKKNYLIINKHKIRIYFKKNISKPLQNNNIFIKNAIISIYNSKLQLSINKQSDFKVTFR